jgi:hypothetical protein
VQEVLEKANQMFSLNPRLSESLKEISEKIQERSSEQQQADQLSTTPAAAAAAQPAAPELPKALRGLNPKLLEKIRQAQFSSHIYFFLL